MADEIIVPLDGAEAKPVSINASTSASTEYTDDKGKKLTVTEEELNPENLKTTSIQRIETVSNLKELAAKASCQNCRFWNPTEIRQNKEGKPFPINGECRVNAPTNTLVYEVDAGRIGYSNSFPLIGPFQWCGKHEKIA